jgi:hypothetical protein
MKNFKVIALLAFIGTCSFKSFASSDLPDSTIKPKETVKAASKKWYDTFAIRGYMQIRYNRLLETNEKLKCEQCDRSIGEGGGFFVRRMRIIFSGNVGENVYFYV